MYNAITDNNTGAIIKFGYCDFTGDYNVSTQTQVILNEGTTLPLGISQFYCKVVTGNITEMTTEEKTLVDNSGIINSSDLINFLDVTSVVTDSSSGITGEFLPMQTLVNRRELFNDNENPLYIPSLTPILGANGILQSHANRISTVESIHNKNGWHEQQIKKAIYYKPSDLLIYYGWMNAFNSSENGNNNELVSQDMSKYSIIILGSGIQDPSHGDYSNSSIIISRIKILNPNCLIFGYVTTLETISNFQTKVTQWNTLGVHGIFLDEAGYDFGTNRTDFNTKVDYVHSMTYAKICFINAWNIDHIIGTDNDVSYPNTTWNSTLVESNLTNNDWYLLESFAINTSSYSGNNGYETSSSWSSRGIKAISKRNTYGINLASVGIIENSTVTEIGSKLFNFGFISSLMFSLEAFGTSDINYGASSAKVIFWDRPINSVISLGTTWSLSPSVVVDISNSNFYWRFVEFGKLKLDFTTGSQESGIFNNLPQQYNGNISISNQTVPAARSTLLIGSVLRVPTLGMRVGAQFKWEFTLSKTAAGVQAKTFYLRCGSTGTLSDSVIATLSLPAGTGVVDRGRGIIDFVIRTIGSSASGFASINLSHNLATTGLANVPNVNVAGTMVNWNSNTTRLYLSVSFTSGNSEVITFHTMIGQCINIGNI